MATIERTPSRRRAVRVAASGPRIAKRRTADSARIHPLARVLLDIRHDYLAKGGKLASTDTILAELAQSRGA